MDGRGIGMEGVIGCFVYCIIGFDCILYYRRSGMYCMEYVGVCGILG